MESGHGVEHQNLSLGAARRTTRRPGNKANHRSSPSRRCFDWMLQPA